MATIDEMKMIGISLRSTLYKLFGGLADVDNGGWIETHNLDEGTIEFLNHAVAGNISAISCQVMGSNALAIGSNSVDGFDVVNPVTAISCPIINSPTRSMQIKTTILMVAAGGTLGARMHAISY